MAFSSSELPAPAGESSTGESAQDGGSAEMDYEVRKYEEVLRSLRDEVWMFNEQREEFLKRLRNIQEYNSVLEERVLNSKRLAMELEAKLGQTEHVLESVQREKAELSKELEEMAGGDRGDDDHHGEVNHTAAPGKDTLARVCSSVPCTREFSSSELRKATRGFDSSLVIARGRHGVVYRGVLGHTAVAIKVMDPGRRKPWAFRREVEILSRARHPNVVSLLGACSEGSGAFVYEYLPNGTLADRLCCDNRTPPLTWQLRTSIATQVLSALTFLHGNRPRPLFHGNLTPAHVLLGANDRVVKVSGFGTGSIPSSLLRRDMRSWASSDVSSFGSILLALLTGSTTATADYVAEATQKKTLERVLDESAGAWPDLLASQLVHLALRCCRAEEGSPEELVSLLWAVLEQETPAPKGKAAVKLVDDVEPDDPYFICPISQEVMFDPQVAADGYTYEADHIQNWFDSGHDKSPMTNAKLPHLKLLPNRGLRAAVDAWHLQHYGFGSS